MTIMNMSEEIEIRQNSIQKTTATAYKRRLGDRADGRRLRTLDPMANVATYLMATRSGSQNLFSDAVDIEKMNKYIDFKDAKISIFEYIESWYNRKRIHSRIGYMTPQAYEDLITQSA